MKKSILIKGARQHNLRSLDVEIPRDQLVVVTGPSGSGKSSLAFDTLFAEGQRKYVESLSVYARQFLDQLEKPDVDLIEGLSPAIAIEQRVTSGSQRSTIATSTEIYDFLRLLYAAVGQPHDPATGEAVTRKTAQQIVEEILVDSADKKLIILAPVISDEKGQYRDLMEKLKREGFVRVRVDGVIYDLADETGLKLDADTRHTIEVVIDRLIGGNSSRTRLSDSVALALKWGRKRLLLLSQKADSETWLEQEFSTDFVNPATGFRMPELNPKYFSFNSHLGACPACHGMGTQLVCDPSLIVPDETLSLQGGAVRPWFKAGKRMKSYYLAIQSAMCRAYGVSDEQAYASLPEEFRTALLQGTGQREITIHGKANRSIIRPFEGVIAQLEKLFTSSKSELSRRRIRNYMNRQSCPVCQGCRLRPEILSVTLTSRDNSKLNIQQLCSLSVSQALKFVEGIELSEQQQLIVSDVLKEIRARISFLADVGLGYLALGRESMTLSGGEAQRIRLATQLGAGLAGVLYVLDEPSIGLHQRDNARLLATLRRLQQLGNSVIVVEHDEETIREADYILDLGPGAGPLGGRVVASGQLQDILESPESVTGSFLSGRMKIEVPRRRVQPRAPLPRDISTLERALDSGWMVLQGAAANNLKGIDVGFPLGCFICVTGISGSGKSSLVDDILRKALARKLHSAKDRPGQFEALYGLEQVDKVIVIDQAPIGRTPRSNPATYTGLLGPVRELFAQLPLARVRGYDAGRFSFNVTGGRCDVCKGDGKLKIEMHFLPDVYVDCEECNGSRYNRETLEIAFKGNNIADILAMTVDEAADFFRAHTGIIEKLNALQDVGLGYITLGQSANTLSGGEAQRVKLATELARKSSGQTVYIFDEPTTGLHFVDIQRLLEVMMRLRDAGNTLVVVEHNLDMIKSADWIIDLGPEGGEDGGRIVAAGPPEEVAAVERSYTGNYLKPLLPLLIGLFCLIWIFYNPAVSFAEDGPQKSPSQLDRAKAAMADGMPALAVQLLRSHPDSSDAEVLSSRVLALLMDGQAQQALEELAGASESPEIYFLRALAHSMVADWQAAENDYQQALAAGYENTELVTLGLAEARLRLGQWEQTTTTLESLLGAGNPAANLIAAEAKLLSGQPAAALQQLQFEVVDNRGLESRSKYLKGLVLIALERYQEALAELLPIYEKGKDITMALHAGAGLAAAEAMLQQGNFDQAVTLLENYIDARPSSPHLQDYFTTLQQLYLGKENLSTRQLRLWVLDSEQEQRAFLSSHLLAKVLIQQNDHEQAAQFLAGVIEQSAAPLIQLDAIISAARIRAETDVEQAVNFLRKQAAKLDNEKHRHRLLYVMASILQQAGRYEEAAGLFAEVAELSKQLAEMAEFSRAQCLLGLSQYGKFLDLYKAFSVRFPESPLRSDLLLEEGLMQARQGAADAKQTLSLFLRDFSGHKRSPEALIALVEIALAELPPDLPAARLLLADLAESELSESLRNRQRYLSIQLLLLDPQSSTEIRKSAIVDYLESYPSGRLTRQARMALAEIHFAAGDFAAAQTQFEILASSGSEDSDIQLAYYLAADSAVRTLNPVAIEQAVDLYEAAARIPGPLQADARVGQARIKFRQGSYQEALVIYNDLLEEDLDAITRADVILGKAETLIAEKDEAGENLQAAAVMLSQLGENELLPSAIRNQAHWKAGQIYEETGRHDLAIMEYYEAFAENPASSSEPDYFWFYKAAFDAAKLLEGQEKWPSAAGIYRTLANTGGPRAAEAEKRLNRLRLEHFLWED